MPIRLSITLSGYIGRHCLVGLWLKAMPVVHVSPPTYFYLRSAKKLMGSDVMVR